MVQSPGQSGRTCPCESTQDYRDSQSYSAIHSTNTCPYKSANVRHSPKQLQSLPSANPLQSVKHGLARASRGRLAACPHLLQIVEGADLGPENMHDDIARIDEHPVAMRRALDARRKTGPVEVLHDPVGDR